MASLGKDKENKEKQKEKEKEKKKEEKKKRAEALLEKQKQKIQQRQLQKESERRKAEEEKRRLEKAAKQKLTEEPESSPTPPSASPLTPEHYTHDISEEPQRLQPTTPNPLSPSTLTKKAPGIRIELKKKAQKKKECPAKYQALPFDLSPKDQTKINVKLASKVKTDKKRRESTNQKLKLEKIQQEIREKQVIDEISRRSHAPPTFAKPIIEGELGEIVGNFVRYRKYGGGGYI